MDLPHGGFPYRFAMAFRQNAQGKPEDLCFPDRARQDMCRRFPRTIRKPQMLAACGRLAISGGAPEWQPASLTFARLRRPPGRVCNRAGPCVARKDWGRVGAFRPGCRGSCRLPGRFSRSPSGEHPSLLGRNGQAPNACPAPLSASRCPHVRQGKSGGTTRVRRLPCVRPLPGPPGGATRPVRYRPRSGMYRSRAG